MAQQHKIAIAYNRSQNIVKIVRHAAGQLTDGFHFRLLRDLAFQDYLFAVVFQPKQHGGVTQPTYPSDG